MFRFANRQNYRRKGPLFNHFPKFKAEFYDNSDAASSGLVSEKDKYQKFYCGGGKKVEVQCVPIYTMMVAANFTKIDFFSLDIESAELSALKQIPWDKVDIKVELKL